VPVVVVPVVFVPPEGVVVVVTGIVVVVIPSGYVVVGVEPVLCWPPPVGSPKEPPEEPAPGPDDWPGPLVPVAEPPLVPDGALEPPAAPPNHDGGTLVCTDGPTCPESDPPDDGAVPPAGATLPCPLPASSARAEGLEPWPVPST
jgi:hypothetical protein